MIAPMNPRNIMRSQVLINKEVTLTGKHPFAGEKGTIVKIVASVDGRGLNLKVLLDDGRECTVTEREQLNFDTDQFNAIKLQLANGNNGHDKSVDPGSN